MRSRGTTTPRASGAGAERLRRVDGAGGTWPGVRVGAAVPVVVGLVVAGVALAGCSGSPEPTPSVTWTAIHESPWPTSTPTPTPTPTPTDPAAVPPERPAAMDTGNTAGAEAVATYFMHLFAYSFATNDLTSWAALSHPDCVYCSGVIDAVKAQSAAAQRSTGGTDTITAVSALEVDPGKWWTVDVDLVQAPSATLDAAGAVVEDFPDTVTYHMDVAVIRDGERWLVRELSYTVTARSEG